MVYNGKSRLSWDKGPVDKTCEVTDIKNLATLKNYKLGLSITGILAVVLVMLPNILSLFLTPPNDVLAGNEASNQLLNVLENIGRFGLMISLCIVVNKSAPPQSRGVTIAAACSLLAYYALWIAYFLGSFTGLSLVGMAVFPSAFFLLIAWRLRNIFALGFATLFTITHVAITSGNFLF